mgnify:FL=1
MKGKKFSVLLVSVLAICFVFAAGFALVACNDGTENKGGPGSSFALERYVEYVENNYPDNEEGRYTEESFAALSEALEDARVLLEKGTATQEELNACEDALRAAVEALVPTFEPNYSLTAIAAYIQQLENNYTLRITDYLGGTDGKPLEYKTYYTDTARYNEYTQSGFVSYDGYVHTWRTENGQVRMGGPYLLDWAPPFYLEEDEILGAAYSIGDFYDYEIEASAGYDNIWGTNVYYTENPNFVRYFMNTTLSGYDAQPDFEQKVSGTSLEMNDEGTVLTFGFYGQSADDLLLKYEVTDIGSTDIPAIEEYIKNNPGYETAADPTMNDGLYALVNGYESDRAYGMRFEVYNTYPDADMFDKAEKYTNYSVYNVYNEDGYNYWYSTATGGGIADLYGVSQSFVTENGTLEIAGESGYTLDDIEFCYNFADPVTYSYYGLEQRDKTDEFYFDLTKAQGFTEFLVRFFGIQDYDAENKPIVAVSVTENGAGELVVSLWKTGKYYQNEPEREMLALRAVLKEWQNVHVEIVEQFIEGQKDVFAMLSALVNEVKDYSQNDYTSASFSSFSAALTDAKNILAESAATEEMAREAYSALTAAVNGLEKRASEADVAELRAYIEEAKTYSREEYTASSFADLTAAIEAAEEYLSSGDLSAEKVQELYTALDDAVRCLVELGDRNALAKAVAAAEGADRAGKTSASIQALEAALLGAKELAEKAEITADEVEEAVAALEAAVAGLENIADTSALEALLVQYAGVNAQDYTAASYDAFNSVRTAAESAVKEELGERSCNEYIALLKARYAELEKKDFQPAAENGALVAFVDEQIGVAMDGESDSYKLTVTAGGESYEFVYTSEYFYDTNGKWGYMLLEGAVWEFTVSDGKVVPVGIVSGPSGPATSIYEAAGGFGMGGFAFSESMGALRIPNSSEWFVHASAVGCDMIPYEWIPFLSEKEDAVIGYSAALNNGVLSVSLWSGSSLEISFDSNTIEDIDDHYEASMLRLERICTAVVSEIGTAKIDFIEEYLQEQAA